MLRAMNTARLTSEILALDGWTQTRLANEVGVRQPTVARWVRGQDPEGPSRDKLRDLHARLFQTAPDPTTLRELPNAFVGDKLPVRVNTIPLYGHAVGGQDGEFVLNGNKLDDISAPPSISGAKDAYAVTVAGDSMEPRYEDGETVFVDPNRRVHRGDYVVAQIQYEDEGPRLAYIKRFVKHTADELVLEQFNPPKQLTFPHANVHSVHYIVMGGRVV